MEIIQLEPSWQKRGKSHALPEEKLIFSIIKQAWLDANERGKCITRKNARWWFFSEQFEYYCEILNIDVSVMQTRLIQYWKSQGEL